MYLNIYFVCCNRMTRVYKEDSDAAHSSQGLNPDCCKVDITATRVSSWGQHFMKENYSFF